MKIARVAELADALDSKSSELNAREGSSPSSGTPTVKRLTAIVRESFFSWIISNVPRYRGQNGMSYVDFDEADAKVISVLVDYYDQHGAYVEFEEVTAEVKLDNQKVEQILERFCRYELVERVDRGGTWQIMPQLLSVADQLSAPKPEPDYPKAVEKWFRAKWWSVPFYLTFVGLPALVGYITMLRTLLAWLGLSGK